MRLILGERNVEPGALEVDFETFKKIYQLLIRAADKVKKGATLLRFTLSGSIAPEEFKEMLIHALRRSDCISQSDDKKFLVLLIESTESDSLGMVEQIFSRLDVSQAKNIFCEREQIF